MGTTGVQSCPSGTRHGFVRQGDDSVCAPHPPVKQRGTGAMWLAKKGRQRKTRCGVWGVDGRRGVGRMVLGTVDVPNALRRKGGIQQVRIQQ
jgi:hypothetical protein